MIKKYLNYDGLEVFADLIKQKFNPIEEAIGKNEDDGLIAVTDRIKDEACDANYKEKEVTVYTFTQDNKTFIITSKDILTGKTADSIVADDKETKLSDIYPNKTLNEIIELLENDHTIDIIMYSIRDQLDELIEQGSFYISKVTRIDDENYEIEVTNGKRTLTTAWKVKEHQDGTTIWTSDSSQTIDMLGFESEELVGKFWRDENEVIKGEYFNNYEDNIASGDGSHAEGGAFYQENELTHRGTFALGENSHAEGLLTYAVNRMTHAEGWNTCAAGEQSHTEGWGTRALGHCSHAEGHETSCMDCTSHTEGYHTYAALPGAHAEGGEAGNDEKLPGTYALGVSSHAEGINTTAEGWFSHAENEYSYAGGEGAHAEGGSTSACGAWSHTEGLKTITTSSLQHAEGQYNLCDEKYVHMIGNGTEDNSSNAFAVTWGGDIEVAGSITIGNTTITEVQLISLLALLN